MDAVTYPDEKVASFILEQLIPLRIPHNAEPFAGDFNIKWTPTLITLDAQGSEHHRTVGFLGPDELVPSLLLGIGKTLFELERFQDAIDVLDKLIEAHPKSDSTPEAIFLRGVATYKNTHDPKPLRAAYDKLTAQFPNSEWTKRAYPYRLIN